MSPPFGRFYSSHFPNGPEHRLRTRNVIDSQPSMEDRRDRCSATDVGCKSSCPSEALSPLQERFLFRLEVILDGSVQSLMLVEVRVLLNNGLGLGACLLDDFLVLGVHHAEFL